MKKMVKVSEKELLLTKEDTWDYLFLFLSKYYETIEVDPTVEFNSEADNTYAVLVAYNVLVGEMLKGGFLELIYNGYGDYIFNDCFCDLLRTWGADKMALNIEKAKGIYLSKVINKPAIEDNDFLQFLHFNLIDKEFFCILNSETEKISSYIRRNFYQFAIVA